MTKLLSALIFLSSVSCFASTSFIEQSSSELRGRGVCEVLALQKVISFAMDNEAKIFDVYNFRLVKNDKKLLVSVHYSWYEMDVEFGSEVITIRTKVQSNRVQGECI